MPSLFRQLKREAEGGDERWVKEGRHLGNPPGKPRTIEGDDLHAERSIGTRKFAKRGAEYTFWYRLPRKPSEQFTSLTLELPSLSQGIRGITSQ